MKKFGLLILLFTALNILSFSQTTIFSENVGNPSATTLVNVYSGWQNTIPITFTGDVDVRTSTPSTGYTGASGQGNVFITNAVNRYLLISGINTSGFENITLSLGHFKSTNAGSNELLIQVSEDGTNWTQLNYTRATGTGTSNWILITPSGTIPAAVNLRIRFTQTSTGPQFRIDDIILVGTPVISTLTATPTTLPDFEYLQDEGPSLAESYNLSGVGLVPAAGNITVTGTSHYHVGLDSTSLSASINIPYTGGILTSTPIYVRLIAGLTQGNYDGEIITNDGGGALQVDVTCNGEVGAPVPVELTTFSASVIGKNIKLSWNTATEINNYGFEVERSVVKGEWDKIGFVNGNGNSNSPKDYSFVDNNLPAGRQGVTTGKYSYRLKQIDNDGQFEYSKTIEVDMNGVKKFELTQNYPNPFNPTTTISYILPQAGMVKLTLYNILGQEIRTLVNEVKEAGTHSINFNASDLNSGVYVYKIESGSFTQTKKMTLVK